MREPRVMEDKLVIKPVTRFVPSLATTAKMVNEYIHQGFNNFEMFYSSLYDV